MEKKIIKIYFTDFWNGFDPENNFFINRIKQYFEIILDSKNPDYLFYSWNGSHNLSYENSVKIYFTGENDAPDFNLCDYAIGFHPIQFNDRYLRMPLYVIYDCFDRLEKKDFSEEYKKKLTERKFCSFVVSNSKAADPIRDKFYTELSKYKKIDSGGRYLNNIGYCVPNKYDFIREYKFNLSFENSKANGYTTEKLVEPLTEHTLPIYWGNPEVSKDFNSEAFINFDDFGSIEALVNEVIRLDKDDEAYLNKITASPLLEGQKTQKDWLDGFDFFVCNILQQPFENSKRITEYGFSRFYRNRNKIRVMLSSLPFVKYIIRKIAYKI